MENQHRKITGYRDLNETEIALMNAIKAKGAELLALVDEVNAISTAAGNQAWADEQNAKTLELTSEEARELKLHESASAALEAFQRAEPFRWTAIGRSDIQQGIMALIRAVTRPDSIC